MLFFYFVCTCLVLVSARTSPHPEVAEKLRADPKYARISDNIYEDARLDVPDLIRKYNYPIEVHSVTTKDGYILEMQRIPHGRDANTVPDPNRPIVLLMHGLLSSAADWVLLGPGCALAYILAEEGFDVWLGNARGTYYSRRHTRLNPDSLFSNSYWEFSWDEIGNLDITAKIDYILEHTGQSRLHYIGHSQGTTVFFVMAALNPDYNDKIISMHALAPVAYMAHNRSRLLSVISPFANSIERLAAMFGIGELLPNSDIMTWAGQNVCMLEIGELSVCSNLIFLVGGWNTENHNATMLPVKLGHTPAGIAVRQLAHYGQGIASKRFRRYDQGSSLRNLIKWGSSRPPTYDVGKITVPVFLHYSDADPLAEIEDVDNLFRDLGRPIGKFLVPLSGFTHVDFMWGTNARALVWDRVMNLIKTMHVSA